jgi:hypothetical protein
MDVMRLWSLSPSYLDTKGLIALWREALLARAVLQGRTRAYKHHPQLERFRRHRSPRRAIAAYLRHVYAEARKRGYSFDVRKVRLQGRVKPIPVTTGQVKYEAQHLLRKLKTRDPERFRAMRGMSRFKANPLFKTIPGAIEPWERVK